MASSHDELAWAALITGELAARAEAAITAIADELGAPDPDDAAAPIGLATGDSGLAVMFTYLALAQPDRGHAERALAYLERALDNVARAVHAPSLFTGYAGVGWTAQHLRGRLLDPDEDACEAIDDALAGVLATGPWPDYDLVHGVVGAGVYALERLPAAAGEACLALVVDRLAELAVSDGPGVTWWTTPRAGLLAGQAAYHDVGLAHGVAGVVSLLGEVCRVAPPPIAARARPLLDGAVAWLLAQRFAAPAVACFPSLCGPSHPPTPARAAWCYGDPGVGLALLTAGRAVGVPAWYAAGVASLRAAAARPRDTTGVDDAGLCHGAIGLGHLLHRAFRATGDPAFADAARAWLSRALDLRTPGHGIGGFRTWAPLPGDPTFVWSADRTVLTGAPGVALGLLAAISPITPAWQRLLCLF